MKNHDAIGILLRGVVYLAAMKTNLPSKTAWVFPLPHPRTGVFPGNAPKPNQPATPKP